MKLFPGVVLALLLFMGAARADDAIGFLQVGNIYYVSALKDAPLPFQNTQNGSTATVKLLQYGGQQWFLVEFDEYRFPSKDKVAPVTIYKNRSWLNLATAMTISTGTETNYAATFPQGFKIVPYDGATK